MSYMENVLHIYLYSITAVLWLFCRKYIFIDLICIVCSVIVCGKYGVRRMAAIELIE